MGQYSHDDLTLLFQQNQDVRKEIFNFIINLQSKDEYINLESSIKDLLINSNSIFKIEGRCNEDNQKKICLVNEKYEVPLSYNKGFIDCLLIFEFTMLNKHFENKTKYLNKEDFKKLINWSRCINKPIDFLEKHFDICYNEAKKEFNNENISEYTLKNRAFELLYDEIKSELISGTPRTRDVQKTKVIIEIKTEKEYLFSKNFLGETLRQINQYEEAVREPSSNIIKILFLEFDFLKSNEKQFFRKNDVFIFQYM